MSTMTIDRAGTALAPDHLRQFPAADYPSADVLPARAAVESGPPARPAEEDRRPPLAVFCYEDPDSPVGWYVTLAVTLLARRGTPVHVFSRRAFAPDVPGVRAYAVGDCPGDDLIGSVQEFTRRACNAFLSRFPADPRGATLLAHDWSAVPAVLTLKASWNFEAIVELHSVEWQRSDAAGDLGRRIAEIEQAGLREAGTVLVHQEATREIARRVVPECADRLVMAAEPFPVHQFQSALDPGEVKARHAVGPVDPTILYLGDCDERYGTDLLVKAMPALLRNHTQVRLVVVGDGPLFWPLRVYSRYLLLDHAIRFAGDVRGQALNELIAAADIVAVPSRESTPWWPILAAWAARKPVVASHEAAGPLLEHDRDSVRIYPNEASVVWGIERVLFDVDLGRALADRGHQKLLDRFGEGVIAAQIEELMGVNASR
jgi:glycogen synthase